MENFLELEQNLSLKKKRKKNNLTVIKIMNDKWESKYFEKNSKESHAYIFKNLEIKHFIKKTFTDQKLVLQNHSVNFSGSVLNLFLSLYRTDKAFLLSQKKKDNKKEFINKLNELKSQIEYFLQLENTIDEKIKKNEFDRVVSIYKSCFEHLKETNKSKRETVFFKFLNETKKPEREAILFKFLNELNKLSENNKDIKRLYVNCSKNLKKVCLISLEPKSKVDKTLKLTKSISLFTNNRLNLNFLIQQTNLVNSKRNMRQLTLRLRKFERTNFSNEGKKLLLPFSAQQNSAKLLARFVAMELRAIKKRQNFFITFLKESLNIIVNQKFSKIQGIKLVLKGRLNNATRSKHRIIKIGKVPLMTTNAIIDYSESTAFTSNGTIGVKIWVYEKN